MSRRPSFQFYPADWRNNAKLRRCGWAARGVWMDVLGLLHDADEYGLLRWPLKEIAHSCGAPLVLVQELARKDVLKGCDKGPCEPYVFTPTHARQKLPSVTLIASQDGPIWFSSRMVRDEYLRTVRGAGTRIDPPPNPQPKPSPKVANGETSGDGSSSSSSSSSSNHTQPSSPEPRAPTVLERWGGAVKSIMEARWPTDPRVPMAQTGIVEQWAADGLDLDLDVLPTVRKLCTDAREPIHGLKYFDGAIRRRHAERTASASPTTAEPQFSPEWWRQRVRFWFDAKAKWKEPPWPWNAAEWGPEPNQPGCRAPPDVLAAERSRNGEAPPPDEAAEAA